MSKKFFSEEPMDGAVPSPFQFEKTTNTPQTVRRTELEIVKEVDTLLWGEGCATAEEFKQMVEEYAMTHPDEIFYYAQNLDARSRLIVDLAMKAQIKKIGDILKEKGIDPDPPTNEEKPETPDAPEAPEEPRG